VYMPEFVQFYIWTFEFATLSMKMLDFYVEWYDFTFWEFKFLTHFTMTEYPINSMEVMGYQTGSFVFNTIQISKLIVVLISLYILGSIIALVFKCIFKCIPSKRPIILILKKAAKGLWWYLHFSMLIWFWLLTFLVIITHAGIELYFQRQQKEDFASYIVAILVLTIYAAAAPLIILPHLLISLQRKKLFEETIMKEFYEGIKKKYPWTYAFHFVYIIRRILIVLITLTLV
jgi:hypothetical protein